MHLAASLACRRSGGSEIAVFISLRFPPESTSHKHKVLVKFKVQGKRECTGNVYEKDRGGKNWREKKRQNSLVLKRKTSVPNSCILSAKPCFLDLLPKDFPLM